MIYALVHLLTSVAMLRYSHPKRRLDGVFQLLVMAVVSNLRPFVSRVYRHAPNQNRIFAGRNGSQRRRQEH